MFPPGEPQPVAGICHARGENAAMPPAWMIYITVRDLDESLWRAVEGGGKAGSGTYIVRVSDGKGNRKTIKILLLR